MERLNELALFAGAGGGLLGSILNGWRTVCAVEINDYCRRVLLQRQADGCLERFPIWDDVTTFDGRPWRGLVDIVTGGFPCQDISAAGKGAGIEGERSGLWSEMARIIGEVRPRFAFVENSPMLTVRGLGRVLGDLAELGFDADWGCVSAGLLGAPHLRNRIWVLAGYANGEHVRSVGAGPEQQQETAAGGSGGRQDSEASNPFTACCGLEGGSEHIEDDSPAGQERFSESSGACSRVAEIRRQVWWDAEPELGRVAPRVADYMERCRCVGNGQVPAVVRAAWSLLGPSAPPASPQQK